MMNFILFVRILWTTILLKVQREFKNIFDFRKLNSSIDEFCDKM